MFLRILPLAALVCMCPCRAEEAKRSPDEWADELCATYAKHSGYKATYEAKGKGKSLTATLAWDRAGDAVLELQGTKDGQAFGGHFWNLDGAAFLEAGGQIMVDTNVGKAMQRWAELSRQLDLSGEAKPRKILALMPQFLLTDDGFNAGLGVYNASKPPWDFAITGSSAVDVDEREVVFHTTGSGKIAVSRKTGMMTRQEIQGKEGEKRELFLSSLEMDPGREAVVEIRQDWSTEGAKEIDLKPLVQGIPLLAFQAIIWEVDFGSATPEKLKEVLAAKSDYLRSFFRSYVPPWKTLSPEIQGQWKALVLDSRNEAEEEAGVEMSGLSDEEKQARKMLDGPDGPALKARVRALLAKHPGPAADKQWQSLFGKAPDELAKPTTENGEKAKQQLVEAVAQAYAEAQIERRVEDAWEEGK